MYLGVVDNDYTGTLKIILINLSSKTFKINAGDRLAQLVVEKYFSGGHEEVGSFTKDTERLDSGFGSTGLRAESIDM